MLSIELLLHLLELLPNLVLYLDPLHLINVLLVSGIGSFLFLLNLVGSPRLGHERFGVPVGAIAHEETQGCQECKLRAFPVAFIRGGSR